MKQRGPLQIQGPAGLKPHPCQNPPGACSFTSLILMKNPPHSGLPIMITDQGVQGEKPKPSTSSFIQSHFPSHHLSLHVSSAWKAPTAACSHHAFRHSHCATQTVASPTDSSCWIQFCMAVEVRSRRLLRSGLLSFLFLFLLCFFCLSGMLRA
ncbi:hypothetical protein P170DRAFT_166824 [Aspergillus steynii IBT 23096]|uniref:Uncharacterized protein n=1 Tax=Aspergillus steynii IBT 23096 TaxID=1392250 RepID=A0A2I2G736_9EURO|nr:uncharacterized protein P170DRAFT_166824 [Aspergillus steynii IBT 23096]PLB48675.1 hypothetical protein P170DRAFT_166824 [Aspergillus steynii IBT 23096]